MGLQLIRQLPSGVEQLLSDPEESVAARAVFALSRIGTPRAVNGPAAAAADAAA